MPCVVSTIIATQKHSKYYVVALSNDDMNQYHQQELHNKLISMFVHITCTWMLGGVQTKRSQGCKFWMWVTRRQARPIVPTRRILGCVFLQTPHLTGWNHGPIFDPIVPRARNAPDRPGQIHGLTGSTFPSRQVCQLLFASGLHISPHVNPLAPNHP